REAAAQFLYSREVNPGDGTAEELEAFWSVHMAKPRVVEFANNLSAGALQHLAEIDELLSSIAENFSLKRFSNIDRNIIRIAAYEILHCPDTPDPVAINEAIEIAKRFGGNDSGRFVNGVLDKVIKSKNSPPPTGAGPTA
ncbi:MAG: transcription antitermination factor NusB, partial [Verrucomicrobiales bacterium]|nr:transcription antitermination factor NusB [Verrucomicrobiales bacterium]